MAGYNGWKNRQTWNIALWLGNDEPYCNDAIRQVSVIGKKPTIAQTRLIVNEVFDEMTPDGVSTLDEAIDWKAISELLEEMLPIKS
jgi:polyhydroxyalkanoate synthesis regulator phasin